MHDWHKVDWRSACSRRSASLPVIARCVYTPGPAMEVRLRLTKRSKKIWMTSNSTKTWIWTTTSI